MTTRTPPPGQSFAAAVDEQGDAAAWERLASRWWSERPVHRFSHRQKLKVILPLLDGAGSVLDVTRGASVDGLLGVLAARTVPQVTIVTPSCSHRAALRRFADAQGVDERRIRWVHGSLDDLDDLAPQRFDVVTALHVLEHTTSLRTALAALHRRTSRRCVVAVPTCVNPTAWVRLGGSSDAYVFGSSSLRDGIRGLARTVARHRRGHVSVTELVDEYGSEVVHRWYFPRPFLRELEYADFEVEAMRPDTLALPWSTRAMAVSGWVQQHAPPSWIAGWGFGTHFVMRPVNGPSGPSV